MESSATLLAPGRKGVHLVPECAAQHPRIRTCGHGYAAGGGNDDGHGNGYGYGNGKGYGSGNGKGYGT